MTGIIVFSFVMLILHQTFHRIISHMSHNITYLCAEISNHNLLAWVAIDLFLFVSFVLSLSGVSFLVLLVI
jgi:hypothetical protein